MKKRIFTLILCIMNICCIYISNTHAENIAKENSTNLSSNESIKENTESTVNNIIDEYTENNTETNDTEEKNEKEDGMRTIKDGLYTISTKINKSKVLSVENESKKSGANIRLWGNINQDFEKFQVTYLQEGYYTITCANSDQSLDVYQAGTECGTNIAQSDFKGGKTQQWYIKDCGNGYYNIISRWNNLSVDVYHASQDNGTNIQLSDFSDGIAQQFLFTEATENKRTLEDGNYAIASSINTNKALDVDGASLKHGKNVQLWDREEVLQQQVRVKYNLWMLIELDGIMELILHKVHIMEVQHSNG